MKEKQIRNPGPDHPISIRHDGARVVVSVAGRVIADTRNALALREADYPAVHYIPREDVDLTQLGLRPLPSAIRFSPRAIAITGTCSSHI